MIRPPDIVAVFVDLDLFPAPRRIGSLRRHAGRGGEVLSGVAVRNDAGGCTKVDHRFTPSHPPADFRVQVSVGLKADIQTGYPGVSLFTPSNRAIMSGVSG